MGGENSLLRRRMSRKRYGFTSSVTISGADFYITTNTHSDGSLGEIFIKFGKQGSTLSGLLDAVSILVSVGLQSGVLLETYVDKFKGMRFEPMGLTDDPKIPEVASILDYVFRRLELDYVKILNS
jgi:ribonucleoside-diphosphate reductase alpha chain